MKRLAFVALAFLLLASLSFMHEGNVECVRASSAILYDDVSDGYVDSDDVVYSIYPQMSLGDWNTNAYAACFVKFNLSGVSGTLSSAILHVYVMRSLFDNVSDSSSPVTNPGLGDCQVIHIADYGTLDASDFSATSIGSDPGVLISGSSMPNVGYVSIDVKAAMQDDIDEGRAWSAFMFKMVTTTDGDDRNDYWVFGTSETAGTSQDPYIEYELAPEPPVYQGNLVLTGNNVTVIEGTFDINGSIIVEENATLILRNALLNFTQTEFFQPPMVFRNPVNGNPRFIAENSKLAISEDQITIVEFLGNSSISINLLKVLGPTCLWFRDHSSASLSKSSLYSIAVYDNSTISVFDCIFETLYPWEDTSVDVRNSTIIHDICPKINFTSCSIDGFQPGLISYWNFELNCSAQVSPIGWAPNITLTDTEIGGLSFDVFGASNMTIRDSKLSALWAVDSSTVSFMNSSINEDVWTYDSSCLYLYSTTANGLHSYQDSQCYLVNSTSQTYEVQDRSTAHVYWYLDCHVTDSISQDVPSANVRAYYHNSTLAESTLTDVSGWVRLTLMEKTKNATGDYPTGTYNVTATYDTHFNQTAIEMTDNRQALLKFEDLIIPEFPSFTILPLFMATALLALIFYKRKHAV